MCNIVRVGNGHFDVVEAISDGRILYHITCMEHICRDHTDMISYLLWAYSELGY